MVGAMAVATKDVRPYHVNVGIPAKSVRVKPNAPPEAYKLTLRKAQPARAPGKTEENRSARVRTYESADV